MRLTAEEQITVDAYNQHAHDWASKHKTTDFWLTECTAFKELLPSGSVLEIGCGGGRDAQLLAPNYSYTGADISEGLLKEFKKNHPAVPCVLSDVYNLPFRPGYFDGFWASAVLLHIPKTRIEEALLSLRSSLKQNAIGFISLKRGQGEELVTDQLDDGTPFCRLFSYYDEEEFTQILPKAGFTVVKLDSKKIVKTTWLLYFVQAM
jgi:SAM-dependent methyltransferase